MKKIVALVLVLVSLITCVPFMAAAEAANTPAQWLTDEIGEDSPAKWALDTLKILGFKDVYGMGPAVESWLAKTVWKDETKESYLLTLPNLKNAGTSGIVKYEGQAPVGYVEQLLPAVARKVQDAAPKKAIEISVNNGNDMVTKVAEFLTELDDYIASSFKAVQAYKAFSRIAFPRPKAEESQSKIFGAKSHAPIYKKDAPRKPLALNAKGAAVTYAQQMLIDKGYMEGGKATSTYTEEMAEAVAAFQKDYSRPQDGENLSLEDLEILLGREDSYEYLMDVFTEFLASEYLSYKGEYTSTPEAIRELLDDRYPLFLRTLSKVQWIHTEYGLELSYALLSLDDFEDEFLEEIIDQYMNKKIKADGMDGLLVKRIQGLWSRKDTEEYMLETTMDFDFDYPTDILYEWASIFSDFNSSYEHIYESMLEYASENPQPLQAPKNGVVDKPKSGKSQIRFTNNSNDMLYVKIYKTDESQYKNKGDYVGSMFVHNNKSATVSLAPGNYTCTLGSGEHWYGYTELFGRYGSYEVIDPSPYIGSNQIWTVTIMPPEDSEGDPTRTEWIPPDEM